MLLIFVYLHQFVLTWLILVGFNAQLAFSFFTLFGNYNFISDFLFFVYVTVFNYDLQQISFCDFIDLFPIVNQSPVKRLIFFRYNFFLESLLILMMKRFAFTDGSKRPILHFVKSTSLLCLHSNILNLFFMFPYFLFLFVNLLLNFLLSLNLFLHLTFFFV